MIGFLSEAWAYTTGVGVPVLAGIACIGAAIYTRIHLTTYLPTTAKAASTVLGVVGCLLLGYGYGRDAERDASKERSLVAQAEAMKTAIGQLQASIVVADALQSRIADNARQQQQFISEQQGKANDLVAQLQSIPVPADCAYTPDERRRLLNIHIRRPAPSGSR